MLAVQKRQKREVVEFKCRYCESPGYVFDYTTDSLCFVSNLSILIFELATKFQRN